MAVGIAAYLFLSAGLNATGRPNPAMPLDDAYIHFQYARSIVEGHRFSYNPDQPPTTGATSLLYPPLLAMGYVVGWQGESLAWWALAIGILSWLGSAWMVYRIAASNGGPYAIYIGIAIAIAFILSGSLGFAFMSGMETGLFIFTCLLTLWHVVRNDVRTAMIGGALAALVRPEGLVIGGVAALYLAIKNMRALRTSMRGAVWYPLPFVAALVQPILNYSLSGSLTASGMQAKSLLFKVPLDVGDLVRGVLTNAAQIWQQMIMQNEYRTTILTLAALMTIIFGVQNAIRTRRLNTAVLVFVWLLGLTFAIATLETAFWQFRRYQQPMIALLFPLAAWPVAALLRPVQNPQAQSGGRASSSALMRLAVLGGVALLMADSIRSLNTFVENYAANVREVANSQMPMARYASTLPPEAVIGVHDIGMMRYLGGRTTYDVIGLTTPGAALAWRNGPGAAYEQMRHSTWRPDYFAIYPDALGLTYFADTSLFGEKLAEFPSTKPAQNVASATDSGQNVYRADWLYTNYAAQVLQPTTQQAIAQFDRLDTLNVAWLDDEKSHRYRWWQADNRPGFASEVYEMDYQNCGPVDDINTGCRVLDGGRLITGGEEFTVTSRQGQDLLWVMRVHPRSAATLNLFANGTPVGTRVIPAIPGRWLEIVSVIPGKYIAPLQTTLRIEVTITDPAGGHYMPYYYWFYYGKYAPDQTVQNPGPPITYRRAVQLLGHKFEYNQENRQISVDLEWRRYAEVAVDAKVFVHVYDSAGKLLEGTQIDERPGGGSLPPANFLTGTTVRDSYRLTLPEGLASGTYSIMIGLYDPLTNERLTAEGEGVDADNRLSIGQIEVR